MTGWSDTSSGRGTTTVKYSPHGTQLWVAVHPGSSPEGIAVDNAGGVYIAASLCWLWAVEGMRPDRWDAIGAGICLIGAAVILFGPRAA